VHRSMTLQLTCARRTLRTNLLGQLREGSSFEAGVSVYPSLDTPALLPTEEELKKILEFQVKDADAGKNTPLEVGISPIYARQDVTASFTICSLVHSASLETQVLANRIQSHPYSRPRSTWKRGRRLGHKWRVHTLFSAKSWRQSKARARVECGICERKAVLTPALDLQSE